MLLYHTGKVNCSFSLGVVKIFFFFLHLPDPPLPQQTAPMLQQWTVLQIIPTLQGDICNILWVHLSPATSVLRTEQSITADSTVFPSVVRHLPLLSAPPLLTSALSCGGGGSSWLSLPGAHREFEPAASPDTRMDLDCKVGVFPKPRPAL